MKKLQCCFSLCQDSNQVRGCIRISKSARVLVHLQAIKLVCRYGRLEGDFVVTQNQNTSNENVVNDVGEFQRCQRCGRVAPDCRWQRKWDKISLFCRSVVNLNKQTNKQINKQTNKQTNMWIWIASGSGSETRSLGSNSHPPPVGRSFVKSKQTNKPPLCRSVGKI